MEKLNEYLTGLKNKKTAIIGAGISNTPLIELLLSANIKPTVRDKRSQKELGEIYNRFSEQGVIFILGDDYLNDINEEIIFRTPGLMPTNPDICEAVSKGSILTSEMEVFFDLCPCKIIAVTGSSGKTTTASIIAELLKNAGKTVHLGGNIGKPLLIDVDNIDPDDIAVIELSSFQLITMKKSPDIAVVTNLSPNHLDVHSDMEEYIYAKSNIFMHQKHTDKAIFNLDNEVTRDFAKNAPAGEILFFSRIVKVKDGVYLSNGTIYEAGKYNDSVIMQEDEILLPGSHNVENYLAAFTAVTGMVDHKIMRETAMKFQGVEHRLEFVRELNGVKYYNDSKASGPESAIAGINALSKPGDVKNIILIAGGKDKGVPFDEFGTFVVNRIKTLVLTGAAAGLIYESAVKAIDALNISSGTIENNRNDKSSQLVIDRVDDFEKAVIAASEHAEPGDIVLLSPACTSFDKFKNFEERGNVFKDIINRLI